MRGVPSSRNRGVAKAKAQSKTDPRKWGRQGGRPAKLDRKGLSQLRRLLAAGRSRVECALVLSHYHPSMIGQTRAARRAAKGTGNHEWTNLPVLRRLGAA
jgi:hypothetical protein